MIPTVILVGLVAGAALGHRRLGWLAVVSAATSLLWGVLVGVIAESVATFLGGTSLATANFAVAAVAGLGVHTLYRAALVRD